jgi:hypothetical protein
MFAIFLLYPIILGHVATHAVKKMIFDNYVEDVKGKVEIEGMTTGGQVADEIPQEEQGYQPYQG